MRFSRGDIVQLKSGGPVMTVADYDHKDVECIWFCGATKMSERFPANSLKNAEEAEIINLFEVVQFANCHQAQPDHAHCVARAVQATIALGSYASQPKGVELLRKIARGGESYPHQCRVIASHYLDGA